MDERRDHLTPSAARRLLARALPTTPEFEAFCVDYFPEVFRRFTEGMDRTTKVNLLLMQVPLVELINRLQAEFPEAAQSFLQSAEDSSTHLEPIAAEAAEPSASGRSANKVPVVLCSFAAAEEALFAELAEHLAVLEHQGVLTLRAALSGSAVGAADKAADSGLGAEAAEADVIVLLLSRRYLAWSTEAIRQAIDYQRGPRHPLLLTVLLGPAMWQSTPLAHLAPPLLDGRPVSGFGDRDAAWVLVANAVRQAILFPPASQRELPPEAPLPPGSVRSLSDIFVYAGPSKVIFVETAQSRELVQRLRLPTIPDGLVVEGPSGTGKTTAVLRALEVLQAERRCQYVSATDEKDLLELDRQMRDNVPQGGYLVIDDFHLLLWARKEAVARLVKRLCDRNRRDIKVVIIGINPIGVSLVEALPDIRGRYSVISMQGRQPDEKIDELIALGEHAANIEFQRRSRFVDEAEGSFALAQRLCYEATRLAGITERAPERVVIRVPAQEVVTQVYQTFEQYYRPRLLAFAAFDEQAPPRGAALLLLWHLSRENEGSVMVREARLQYRQQRDLDAAFEWLLDGNLHRLFGEMPRLRHFLHYRRITGALSAEDPQLWFYLRHLDWLKFARDSGHMVEDVPAADGRPRLRETPVPPRVAIPAPPPPTAPFILVHLSDLHFGTRAQAGLWYGQLAEDLRREMGISRIDALCLSGDLTQRGQEEEFRAAEEFLIGLTAEFELKPHQLVIVPGNHDLSWGIAREAYVPRLRSTQAGALRPDVDFEEGPDSRYVEVRNDEQHPQRFRPFAEFYQRVCRQPYPLHPADQATIHHFGEAGLLILGLNSAWQIDHNYRERSSINDLALSHALDDIRRTPLYEQCALKLALFHHPVGGADEARLRDHGFLQRLAQARFQLALHGHIHESGDSIFPYYRSTAGFHILGAGTFGAPGPERPPSVPLHYQLLELHGGPAGRSRELVVHSRRRSRDSGAWEPDHRYRQAPGLPNHSSIKLTLP